MRGGQFDPLWSVTIPAVILLLSIVVALGLFRYFSRRL